MTNMTEWRFFLPFWPVGIDQNTITPPFVVTECFGAVACLTVAVVFYFLIRKIKFAASDFIEQAIPAGLIDILRWHMVTLGVIGLGFALSAATHIVLSSRLQSGRIRNILVGTVVTWTGARVVQNVHKILSALRKMKASFVITEDELMLVNPFNGQKMIIALFEDAPQAIISVDENERVILMNQTAIKFFGYTRQEMAGLQAQSLMPQVEGHALKVGRRKDGTEFPIEISRSTMHCGKFSLLFILDISARLELQAQLMQAQKMEAIGRFASGVAHDFNNMLTVVLGYNGLLMGEIKDKTLYGYVEEIGKIAERATVLTKSLLEFCKQRPFILRNMSLNMVLEQSKQTLGRMVGEDVNVVWKLPEQVGNIYADPSQIEQIVMNLAVNARDAMPDGGSLTIETRNVTLDEAHPGEFVMLAIGDSGKGMSEETMQHIFEPFFTTKVQGTGLGLSIVYSIVKQSKGEIQVGSELGKGTIFKMYFPKLAAFAETEAPSKSSSVGGSETILLVEDDLIVRKLIINMLSHLGYAILAAVDGVEGIKIAKAYGGKIDMLLTDAVMPNMGGVELAQEMAKLQPTLPVLFISGYAEDRLNFKALPAVYGFLDKPFTIEAFATKVREVLDKSEQKSHNLGSKGPDESDAQSAL